MQNYLISHVLYDGQVQMETVPPKKEDDILDFLEEEVNIPEEELLDDEYIKGMQKLSFFLIPYIYYIDLGPFFSIRAKFHLRELS